jgi:hypothetical protein
MAPPPKPPSPGYFKWRTVVTAAKTTTTTQASTSPVLAHSPSTLSYTDTIVDVSYFIPITVDLVAHNYYH